MCQTTSLMAPMHQLATLQMHNNAAFLLDYGRRGDEVSDRRAPTGHPQKIFQQPLGGGCVMTSVVQGWHKCVGYMEGTIIHSSIQIPSWIKLINYFFFITFQISVCWHQGAMINKETRFSGFPVPGPTVPVPNCPPPSRPLAPIGCGVLVYHCTLRFKLL